MTFPKFPSIQPERLLQMLWNLALNLWALAIFRGCCHRWHVVVVLISSRCDDVKHWPTALLGADRLLTAPPRA